MLRPKIIGADLSLTSTGIALPDGATTTIKVGSLRGYERIAAIRDTFMSIVSTHDPFGVCVEDYAVHAVGNESARAELRGVLLLALYDWNIPFWTVNPMTLKKYTTGKGNAKKEDMKLAAFKLYGREFKNNDECDAYMLRVMAMHALGFEIPTHNMTKALAEAREASLSKVEWT